MDKTNDLIPIKRPDRQTDGWTGRPHFYQRVSNKQKQVIFQRRKRLKSK